MAGYDAGIQPLRGCSFQRNHVGIEAQAIEIVSPCLHHRASLRETLSPVIRTRTSFRSACASRSSMRSGCQPCSFRHVEAIERKAGNLTDKVRWECLDLNKERSPSKG